jgi:hypothetical protein
LIVNESEYRRWIQSRGVGARDRVASSPDSYVYYLNAISQLIEKNISPEILSTDRDLEVIAKQVARKVTSKTLSNYKSAMRQYVAMAANNLSEFFRQASFYRYHALFQQHEREYKIQLHNSLATSRALLLEGSPAWLSALVEAIKSEDDNIIYWEYKNAFLEWITREPAKAFDALKTLWREGPNGFGAFSEVLAEMGLRRPGAQLEITSTLLITLSPYEFPPVKVDSFSRAMKIAGWAGLYQTNNPAERYTIAQSFMDKMMALSSRYEVQFRDRLDVQGVVWCVSGGWPKIPIPTDWVNDPQQRAEAERSEYETQLRDLDREPGSSSLRETEKLRLAKARLGQGKFREDLVRYWSSCAVTRCSNLDLLRASHIKAWKSADNYERLDPFNGLLLSAHLDLAFEKGLITFEDSGRIKISKHLSREDRDALGIHGRLHLCKTSPKHFPYLKHHRDDVFKLK